MATNYNPTSLMKQFEEMKRKHPDAILLFRVGDFYETFADDAKDCADILGITLTRRANGSKNYIQLAGFPHHALDSFLPKLVRAGRRVAICEKIESPLIQKKLRATTSVTDIVSPAPKTMVQALDDVKKAAPCNCRQLTLDFGF